MSKKVWIIGSGVLLVALLALSVAGAGVAFAQGPLPATGQGWQPAPVQGPPVPNPLRWLPGGDWVAFDAAAEALGMTPEDLFAQLHAGKTLDQIAEEQGVDMEEVRQAIQAARARASNRWQEFDALAEALSLTPEELFAQLHAGKTIPQIAEEQGMTMKEVQAALQAKRLEAQKDAILKAVEEDRLTQEEADWLIQGVEGGFFAKLRRFLSVRWRTPRSAL